MTKSLKILFLAEGKLGDSIIITPALKAVKEKYPDSFITILMFCRQKYVNIAESVKFVIEKSDFSGIARVFLDNENVDSVLELDRKAMRSLRGLKRLKAELNCIKYLRKQKYDAVISTFPQNRFVIWAFLAGIKRRIGEKGQQFESLLTDKPRVKRSDAGVLNYFCDLLKPLGITAKDKTTFFKISNEAVENAKRILKELNIDAGRKLLLIHPGASDKDRQWHPIKLAELIERLRAKNRIDILLTYNEYDEDYIADLMKYVKVPIKKIKSETISELAGILKCADAALVYNSGPRHLAAAVGVKTVGLLEKYGDIMWKIYEDESVHAVVQPKGKCDICNEGKCFGIIPNGEIYGAKCMHNISVNEVYSSIERVINNP